MHQARTIVIEHDPLFKKYLTELLMENGRLNIIATFDTPVKAREFVSQNKVDLIFSAILTPDMDGISFLKSLIAPPLFVFVTDYPEYAACSYELDVLDYMIKSMLTKDRLSKCLAKAIRAVADKWDNEALQPIKIKDGYSTHFIKPKDILYVRAQGDYVQLVTLHGVWLLLKTMREMEIMLPSKCFARIHRSYIINIEKIISVTANSVTLEHVNHKIPIGPIYAEAFLARIAFFG